MRTDEAILVTEQWVLNGTMPRTIAVCGGSCSGKTTFSHMLMKRLGDERATVILQDDYFKDIDDPSFDWDSGFPCYDSPTAYDSELFVSHAGLILSGHAINPPVYDVSTNKRLRQVGLRVEPRDVLIVDGLFAFTFLASLPAFRVYMEAGDETCLQRRIKRDIARFGVSEQVIRDVFLRHILPQQERYVSPQRRYADIVVNTD